MKLPRNLHGTNLQRALRTLGYEATRQRGSHVRVTTQTNGEHHEVVPLHKPIRTRTLSSILKSIAAHHGLSVGELQTGLICSVFDTRLVLCPHGAEIIPALNEIKHQPYE